MHLKTLEEKAKTVLQQNDLGAWTQPAPGLYPHQWLWDSCFISIGLRHLDVERAQQEIRSLLRGQWSNGMVPHIIFSDAKGYHAGPWLWRAHTSPNSPPDLQTSGISQPPLIAEAVVKIGNLLPEEKRKSWYSEIFIPLVNYHEWLYRDRDPNRSGVVTVVHPWETGLDNTPPWMEMLRKNTNSAPWELAEKIKLTDFIEKFRKDTSIVPTEERMSTRDLYAVYNIVKQLQRLKYNDMRILQKQKLLLEDLAFNCILIRATDCLSEIADFIDMPLPHHTKNAHQKGTGILDRFWDELQNEYYSIDHNSGELIRVSSIAAFMPLYAGKLSEDKVDQLISSLYDRYSFGTKYGIPTTPKDSTYFKPHCYWQGPVWINTNWLIIEGLERNDRAEEASKLRQLTIDLVDHNGMNEYFSPIDGSPAGISNFSWTAALTLDLIKNRSRSTHLPLG